MENDQSKRQFACDVVQRLREAGFQAHWAGGCVRDLLMGLTPSDYDVATDATPQQVMRLFRKTVPVGVSFGVVRVLGPKKAGEIEVATFRTEAEYLDGRRPASVAFTGPQEDASRRDFTINGMFFDPLTDQVIDYVGGKHDLEAGLLKAIGDPAERFAEDKLRLIRAVRFAARFGLRIEPKTAEALSAMADQITVVAAERIAQELRRMLVHPSRSAGMELLLEYGLIKPILPELLGLIGVSSEPVGRPDQDLWWHSMNVLDDLPHDPPFPLALAALLHETGRISTEGFQFDDRIASENAAEIVRQVAHRLKLSNAERQQATWLSAHHRDLTDPKNMPTSALKRLLAQENINDLLTLHWAEAKALRQSTEPIEFCQHYLREQPDGPIAPEPLLTGNDLKQLGLKPGPAFSDWLRTAYDAQLENRIQTRDEALAWVRDQIEQ